MQSVSRLAVRVRVLSPRDSLGKAAEIIRSAGVGAAPIVDRGVLVGMVSAEGVARALAELGPEEIPSALVTAAPWESLPVLSESTPADEALRRLRESGHRCAAVLGSGGEILGIVSLAELGSAVCGAVRPPVIGGMATPFGVYLTGGGVRAGVGDRALCAAGAFLALQFLVARWLAETLLSPGGLAWQFPVLSRFLLTIPLTSTGLALLLFALLFRVSLLTGYHAAEHQVVHAIEAGDDLVPENVRSKPRVHPRCGTNLVAAVFLMTFFLNLRHMVAPHPDVIRLVLLLDQFNPMLAMLVTVLFWRRLGGWVQHHITTRRANAREIQSGLAAGKELLARYQSLRPIHRSWMQRIWNMGLLQVLSGYLLVLALVAVLGRFLPLPSALSLL